MELKDLVGEHVLDAVDESKETLDCGYFSEDATVLRFRLDGVVYVATEDPDDGYRSGLRDLVIGAGDMTNTFTPCRVIGRHRTEGRYSGVDDVLELIDAVTGKTVLEVGTDNVDDYYPGFVACFMPENMAANAEAGR